MRIDTYDLALASSRVHEQKDQEREELREWGVKEKEETPPHQKHRNLKGNSFMNHGDRVSLSVQARKEYENSMNKDAVHDRDASESVSGDDEQGLDARLMTLKRMIEAFTGKEIKLTHVKTEPAGTAGETASPSEPVQSAEGEAPPAQAWGMSYSYYESHYEYEQTDFSASGMVRTADGREISFSMSLQMERTYYSEESLTITAGAPLIDPLVINYAGSSAELSDMSFEFDLDVDGRTETLRELGKGRGFLVFDRNGDGKVNDGSELFGPATGDGFEELSAFDEDKNNWIDENDSIYTRLSLWERNGGEDVLTGLKESGVGAIYLGQAETPFDLRDSGNDLLGRVQKTGVYLKEDGSAGTVQQIDFSA